MYAMLSASGPLPIGLSWPVLGSIAKLTARNGCERIPAISTRWSGVIASGVEEPGFSTLVKAAVCTGVISPLSDSLNTLMSLLSALPT